MGQNYMEESMLYERAYSEITNIINYAKDRARAQKNGDLIPEECKLVIDALSEIKSNFRERSDEAYRKHCRGRNMCDIGAENLAIAIIERMALDYEIALSERNDKAMREIEKFSKEHAYKYTNIDPDGVLSRITTDYKKFKEKAHKDIFGILEVTEKFRATRHAFCEEKNPYRCPLCGGGMYVKTKLKSNSYIVGCSGCCLTEAVTIHS